MARESNHQRRQIAELSLQGYTQCAISAMTNRALEKVNRIVKVYKDERRIKDASRKPRSPEVTTEQQDCKIVGFATNKPSTSVHAGCDRRLYMLLGHQREYLACSSCLLLLKSLNIQIFVLRARWKILMCH